jgi:CubicO group peptidase (beta-lactamase class C family)
MGDRSCWVRPTGVFLGLLTFATSACTNTPVDQEYGLECASFAPDPSNPWFAFNETYVDADPPEWPTADLADTGLDSARLEEAADAVALSQSVASLLIVQGGELVFERYFNGFGPADANGVHSLSKSVLSVLTGIAIDQGLLTLDTRIDEVLTADLVGEHGDLTVRTLLTMSGGVEVPDPEAAYEWEPGDTKPFVQAVLASPSVAEPGTEFSYSTGLTTVLAAVLTEAAGMPLCDFAAQNLFGPLGIGIDYWHREIGGYFAGGDSLFLTPRDIARFGQLVLDDGAYDGHQLVSTAWLEESLSPVWELGCRARPTTPERYGYLWWNYEIGGHDTWLASGSGSNDLAIVEDLDLVVVITHDTADATNGIRVPAIALLDDIVLRAEPNPAPSAECSAPALTMARVAADASSPPATMPRWPPDVAGPLSPNGDRLAFSQWFAGAWDLYTIAADGTAQVRVTRDGEPDAMPAWSPDNTMLAIARGEPTDSDLYLVTPDGSEPDQLTTLDGWENAPTWSPDGNRIAFIHDTTSVNGWGNPGQLWVIDRDGTHPSILRAEPTSNPAWSPDGTHIAFDSIDGDGHIRLLDLTTGAVTDLGQGALPRWSPDGTRLVFIVADGDGDSDSDLYTMAADGTDRVRLTDDPAFDTLPQWTPDGTTIWYATLRHGDG